MPGAVWRTYGQRGWLLIALGTVALAVALEHLAGRAQPCLLEALLLGLILASARLGVRTTAAVACCALTLGITTDVVDLDLPTEAFVLKVGILAAGCGMAVYAVRCRVARELALSRIAQAAQHAILRPIAVEIGGVEVATRYYSAIPDTVIGGDLFDVANTPRTGCAWSSGTCAATIWTRCG